MDEEYFDSASDTTDEPYEVFDLKLDDGRLVQMVDKSLRKSIEHWDSWPWNHAEADKSNLKYWMGEQMSTAFLGPDGKPLPNMGNRAQTSSRAVLSYVNARVAKPEVAPSSGNEAAQQFAKDLRDVMYQHCVDQDLEEKVGKATQALVIQKRGYLKLRFDPLLGPYGDIAIDYVPPEDVVIEKGTKWGEDGSREWHKQICTIEELIMKFPKKEEQIKLAFEIGRGIYSQLSRRITYWEVWFTYYEQNKRKEGLCWYLPQGKVVLGKMENPNYVYTGDEAQDRIVNFLPFPMKPFIRFSYMNSGKSAHDETSLFEQIKVLQDLYNKRRLQIMNNMDNQKGRTVMDGNAVNDQDASKFFNRDGGTKSILLIKPSQGQNVTNSMFHVPHNPLPREAFEEALDYRNEIDQVMGTPNIFRGEQSKNNTLGQDERIIEQAAALQDDLAKAIDKGMQRGYRKLFHMMKVYYTEDHWFTIKGDNGKYDFVVMNGETMDTNGRVSVESGSTLPVDRKEIRSIAVEAANANKIDDLTFWEAIQYGKLPDPETIVERTQKQLNDPQGFMQDVEAQAFSRDAAIDIALIMSGREAPDRDEYGQAYLEYFNKFIMGNRFIRLQSENPEAAEALKIHVAAAGATAARTANLQATQVDDAAAAAIPEEQVAEVME